MRSPPRSAGRACVPPGTIPAALPAALVLAIVGAATKVGTGLDGGSSCRHRPSRPHPGGVALIARGEFSIVIAGIAVAGGAEPDLGPLAACYVLLLAVCGPRADRSHGWLTA